MPRTGLTADQIKERAVEAALVRMREVGFEKVRLTEIAKELGVSHAALRAFQGQIGPAGRRFANMAAKIG